MSDIIGKLKEERDWYSTGVTHEDQKKVNTLNEIIKFFEKLKAENKKMREALEFYGNKNTWSVVTEGVIVDFSDIEEVETETTISVFGGARARMVLAEIEGEE